MAPVAISLQSVMARSRSSLIRRERLVGNGCAPVIFIFWCWWSSVLCAWPTRVNGCLEYRRYYATFIITKQLPQTIRGVAKRCRNEQRQTGRLHQHQIGR
ncbi:hypothetical protein NP493_1325g00018 [Ridgeia piscesae]|uniref:Uncharacterized protein n=1 Tax=Ridgeia piscesae TaxID=27915 RepID=A0AAD9K7X4_RIDPI|nr:hypothetical protein NP493_1325g00018 [Ridgeia piscesae]